MTEKRGLLLLGLPLVAGSVLLIATLTRPSLQPESVPRGRGVEARSGIRNESGSWNGDGRRVPSAAKGSAGMSKVAVAKDLPTATANARILSTYKNYRTAVVNGNQELQKTLLPVLLRDRETAVGYARGEVAQAATEQDKESALQTLKALER